MSIDKIVKIVKKNCYQPGVFAWMTQSLSLIALKVETASLVAVVDRSSAIIIAVISQVREGNDYMTNISVL